MKLADRCNAALHTTARNLPDRFTTRITNRVNIGFFGIKLVKVVEVRDHNSRLVAEVLVKPFPFGKPFVRIYDPKYTELAETIATNIKGAGFYLLKPLIEGPIPNTTPVPEWSFP